MAGAAQTSLRGLVPTAADVAWIVAPAVPGAATAPGTQVECGGADRKITVVPATLSQAESLSLRMISPPQAAC